jgi:dodecin
MRNEGVRPLFGQPLKHSIVQKEFLMADAVYKKIQLVGTSTTSLSDAVAAAIAKANETVHNMSWFEVEEQRGSIVDGKIKEYQVTISVGFRVD